MKVVLNLSVKCKLCGNDNESEFYITPVEKKCSDGTYHSNTKYKFICKKCGKTSFCTIKFEITEE